jgi:hypothetical protein
LGFVENDGDDGIRAGFDVEAGLGHLFTEILGVSLEAANQFDVVFDFLNDDERYRIYPVVKIAIAHYQFEAIYPFWYGNERTGTISSIHFLTQKGFLDYLNFS